jgi:hypothetical protein
MDPVLPAATALALRASLRSGCLGICVAFVREFESLAADRLEQLACRASADGVHNGAFGSYGRIAATARALRLLLLPQVSVLLSALGAEPSEHGLPTCTQDDKDMIRVIKLLCVRLSSLEKGATEELMRGSAFVVP